MKVYSAKWEQTGRPDLIWNSMETYFIWVLRKGEEVGGKGKNLKLYVCLNHKEWVKKMSGDVISDQGPNLMFFSQKDSTNLVPTTFYEAVFDAIWKFVVVQLLSCVWLFVTPWTAAHRAPLKEYKCPI